MLTVALTKFRAWMVRPCRDGRAGLTTLARMICRLRFARLILRLARVLAWLAFACMGGATNDPLSLHAPRTFAENCRERLDPER